VSALLGILGEDFLSPKHACLEEAQNVTNKQLPSVPSPSRGKF